MEIELETKLLIDSPRPETILHHLARIDRIGPFEIVSTGDCTMSDRYFDTVDRLFQENKAALRLRQVGSKVLLCMKAKECVHGWGGIERIEIEKSWSKEALEKIICAMDITSLKPGNMAFREGAPVHTLRSLGLHCIQNRKTHRITRDIMVPENTAGSCCAEMALDTVYYRSGRKCFRHFEVEIEEKKAMSEQYIQMVVDLLKKEFPGELRRWDHNKLMTGLALDAIVRKGSLRPSGQLQNTIGHLGYEQIDALIREEYL